MNEYGSEFYFEKPKSNNEKNNFWLFGTDRKFVFSGRTALDYALKDIKKKDEKLIIYLPNYICESVINTIKENKITIKFYTVEIENNEFKYNINLDEKIDIFFGMSYFGTNDHEIDKYINYFSNKHIIVIEDITHRLLNEKNFCENSDYLICSLRKWFPIISGGLIVSVKRKFNKNLQLSKPSKKYVILKKHAMKLKKIYILKRPIPFIKKIYMKLFKICQQEITKNYKLKRIDNYSLKYLNTIDINQIKKIRINNGKYIIKNLNNQYIKPIGKMKDNCCPLFIPCIVEKKELILKSLLKNNIYFPSHWPICKENKKYKNNLFIKEISIVCDQRYSPKEIKNMIHFLNNIEKEINNGNNH